MSINYLFAYFTYVANKKLWVNIVVSALGNCPGMLERFVGSLGQDFEKNTLICDWGLGMHTTRPFFTFLLEIIS